MAEKSRVFKLPNALNTILWLSIFWHWAYLMTVIPATYCVH